jgi:hypothetical protein
LVTFVLLLSIHVDRQAGDWLRDYIEAPPPCAPEVGA